VAWACTGVVVAGKNNGATQSSKVINNNRRWISRRRIFTMPFPPYFSSSIDQQAMQPMILGITISFYAIFAKNYYTLLPCDLVDADRNAKLLSFNRILLTNYIAIG
jgi:hypothetical protein